MNVAGGDVDKAHAGFVAGPGYMWGEEGVFAAEQGIARTRRFFGKNIGTVGTESACKERIGYILITHQRTATCVDEDGRGFHELQGAAVDEMMGIGCQRTVQTYHIALRQEFVDSKLLDASRQHLTNIAARL